ncbi:MAG: SpoIIE family protein phosphatase [Byssovorax sp.]
MGALLIDRWLGDRPRIPILDEASVSLCRTAARELGASLGLDEVEVGKMALVASELGMNHLRHARRGAIAVGAIHREGVPGLEIIAADEGPGIADPTAALAGTGPFTGLGVGLGAVLRLSAEVDVDIRLGEGVCVRARLFAGPAPRRREVAIFGRPCKGEAASGDDAGFVRREHELWIGVADGLGHGPEARVASIAAIAALEQHADRAPEEVLARAEARLASTRGAVMSVVRLDETALHLAFAGAGNVMTRRLGPDGSSRSYAGPGRVLGRSSGASPRLTGEQGEFGERDVLVMFSDGLRTRSPFPSDRALLRRHPILIAHHLFRELARDNDDATVLVVG